MGSDIQATRKRFKRKIRYFTEIVRKDIVAAMVLGADEITAQQKALVPEETGAVKKSITWSFVAPPEESGSNTMGDKTPKSTGDLRIWMWAGSAKAYYARWIEFGSKGGAFGPQRARPFFFPVWRALKRRIKSRITRNANKAIKKAAKSG